ncbi:hypothetical protein GCM10009133_39700 [Cocleimonas flava]|uniref:Uncharacterized protein n=1 Tax=Cocleimonas flava TaxID=634765 RepID=A0A4R1F6K4_9GAMM|nr:hypothetical protein [Cocleimonas flava]TCJ88192.1 hypothetical protein EV695_0031 [Cocleimonas flava]
MSPKPEIHLSIPALFEPLELWKKGLKFEVTSDYLSLLLTSLEFVDVQKVQGLSACFFSNLGWKDKEIPAAYFRASIHPDHALHSSLIQDKRNIMCADPVHFEVGMKDVTLTQTICDLTEADAKEILALLNQYFRADGLQFFYGSNQHWYVLFPSSEVIETTPLEDVLNKNIIASLPFSEQRNWQQIQNEIQMILHSSEVNKRREMAGLIPLNSLWFWGGGKPKKIKTEYEKVFSSDEDHKSEIQGKMLAQAVDCKWYKLPSNGNALLTQIRNRVGKYFVLLDRLQQPVREENLDAYQTVLTQIDEGYIKPLMQAWKSNQIDLVLDAADGSRIRPIKPSVLKFWKKPRSLSDVAVMINQQKMMLGKN